MKVGDTVRVLRVPGRPDMTEYEGWITTIREHNGTRSYPYRLNGDKNSFIFGEKDLVLIDSSYEALPDCFKAAVEHIKE